MHKYMRTKAQDRVITYHNNKKSPDFSLTKHQKTENKLFPNKGSYEATEINSLVAAFWNITFANKETLSQTTWLP